MNSLDMMKKVFRIGREYKQTKEQKIEIMQNWLLNGGEIKLGRIDGVPVPFGEMQAQSIYDLNKAIHSEYEGLYYIQLFQKIK